MLASLLLSNFDRQTFHSALPAVYLHHWIIIIVDVDRNIILSLLMTYIYILIAHRFGGLFTNVM